MLDKDPLGDERFVSGLESPTGAVLARKKAERTG
jgi:hypothetical protein